MSPQSNKISAFCHPWGFLAIFYYCFTFAGKERSPEILFVLNLALSLLHTRKLNRFLQIQSLFDCNKMTYEINSQILHQVIRTNNFATHETISVGGLEI